MATECTRLVYGNFGRINSFHITEKKKNTVLNRNSTAFKVFNIISFPKVN